MSTSTSPTTPLLDPGEDSDRSRRSLRRQSLREAARFVRRASSRRLMREPSMLVRESAAEQLENQQSDWAYSKPVVIMDIVWNLAFVLVAVVVLFMSWDESPNLHLRLWILGYALQCLLHIGCVCVEYRRRRWRWRATRREGTGSGEVLGSGEGGEGLRYVTLAQMNEEGPSTVAKHLESANTMFSFIWWIIGFYWVSAGGQRLAEDSPQIYWLCIAFLAFDVFFVVFCVALACVIGIAVCCCLPCIIAVLYAVADQEGATKEDIEKLLKYKFRRVNNSTEKLNGEIEGTCGGLMTECDTDNPIEHVLSPEDAECCICISAYDDGAELRELPCGHHFHCSCVDKWLHIHSTCPLCKFNILKSTDHGNEEEV
ncbi:hypothetical protein LguiA_015608 [Lonicera macranthoides]